MTPKYEGLGRKLTIESRNEKLGRYFLGHLSEEENDRLEQDTAVDPVSFEKAQIFESELIDEYLRDDLSASDRKAFRTSYLRGDGRREKLASSASLWRVANEQEVKALVGSETPTLLWRMLNDWRVAFSSLAVAMLLIVGLVYLGIKSGVKVEVGQQWNGSKPLIGMTENRDTEPTNNAVVVISAEHSEPPNRIVLPKDTPKEMPSASGSSAPTLASFTLLPGALRDEGEQFIKIAPKTRNVSLRLSPPKDAPKYPAYSAVIKTADGETIYNAPTLKSLRLILPANKLENRTHIIFLEGRNTQNTFEPVAEYTFRVRR